MPKKVLILIGIPNFDYQNSKSAVLSYLEQLEEAFMSVGHEVVLDFRSSSLEDVEENSPNSKSNSLIGRIKNLMKLWPWFYHSLVMRKYLKAQDDLFKELSQLDRFDQIVEFHTVGSTIGVRLAKLWSASFSVIFDSPIDEQFVEMHGTKTWNWKHIVLSEKKSVEAAGKILCYSIPCQQYLERKYDITANVSILPCVLMDDKAIDTEETQTFNIGFIGSFLSWHKVELLVKVFEIFQRKFENSRLILIGFGEEWEKVNKLVQTSDAQKKIELPGFVSKDELYKYKSRFSVGVMPGSNWYGAPLKLFEYAQAGIPFIAPVSETVSAIFEENEHCLYVKKEDEFGSLLSALEKLYLDPVQRSKMGQRAQRFVRANFEKDKYYSQLNSYLIS